MTTTDWETASATPVKVRKLGHLVYEVSDVERSAKFWTEILGFSISDTNELGMIFLRHGNDHHSVALVPGKSSHRPPASAGLAFAHLAMEVDDMAALFKARDFFLERGVPIVFEGRKGPGGNPGIEFTDPDGFVFELYCAMDQIGSDGKSRPSEQFDRVQSLEEAVARPLPARW